MSAGDRRRPATYAVAMRAVLALLVLTLSCLAGGAASAAAGIDSRGRWICRDDAARPDCRPLTAQNSDLRGPGFVLVDVVDIAPERVRSDRPVMVLVVAMAAAEVRWNGVAIGANGRPGADAAEEIPGRFVASFMVPPELVRPGRNVATARVSSHHLPLPVRNAVHIFEVADHEDPTRVGLLHYLPALLVMGVLAVAALYFAVAAGVGGQRGAGLLAGIAGLAMSQLAVETLRVFVNYPYPWHVARVAGIAALAALTAVLVAAWAGRRFEVRPGWAPVAATALAAGAALALDPGYDGKASWAVLAGFVAFTACALDGRRRRMRGAGRATVLGLAAVALWLWQGPAFLDRAYYLLMAAALAALTAAQVLDLGRARRGRAAEGERAEALEAALARREAQVASIRDGARTHRVPVADILCLRAADDYCEVRLADGRTLLSTQPLAQTLADLPGDFVRVHKSWAVNADHVAAIGPRPGGGRCVTLSGGAVVPVGRTWAAALDRFG